MIRGTGSRDTASGRARAGEQDIPQGPEVSTVKVAGLQASQDTDGDGLAHATSSPGVRV